MRKCAASWCGSRTSNPVWGAYTVPGGFDSHALPPFHTEIIIFFGFDAYRIDPTSLTSDHLPLHQLTFPCKSVFSISLDAIQPHLIGQPLKRVHGLRLLVDAWVGFFGKRKGSLSLKSRLMSKMTPKTPLFVKNPTIYSST